MIPLRVTMSGWMRYRERQTADFSGARLLAICGENGAGKSSIFDAITYALFGTQRLGSQNVDELVSEGLDQCMVEFEFEAAGRRYRVRRSRNRRPSPGSQGLWAWDDGVDDWVAVAGADKVAGLNRAVATLVRLSPDAFNSSFLLQQGEWTKFLDADPAPRFKIVSSLVNLEAYEALEKRAREAQREAAGTVQHLTQKLAGYEGVDAESLALLRARLDQAGEQRRAALAERDRANALRDAAREFARLSVDIAATQRHIEADAELLAEADQIEADARRFAALDGELATVRQVQDEMDAAAKADATAESARAQLVAIDLDTLTAAAQRAADRATETAAQIERLADEHRAAAHHERAASDFRTLAAQIVSLRRQLAEQGERLAASASDLDRLPETEARVEHLRAVAAALPLLSQYGKDRQTAEKLNRDDPRAALAAARERHDALLAGQEAAVQAAEEASTAAREAERASAAARAEANALAEQLTRRREAADEAVCSRCGQRIDPDLATHELVALEAQTAEARAAATTAADRAATAEVLAREAARRRDDQRESLRQATTERDALARQVEALDEALAAAHESYERFAEDAPESLRLLVDETLPLARIHELYKEQQAVAAGVAEAEAEVRRLQRLDADRRAAELQIDRLKPDLAQAEARAGARLAAVPDAEAQHAEAERRLHEAQAALDAAHLADRQAKADAETAREALAAAREQRRTLEQEQRDAERTAEGHRRTARRLAAPLEPSLGERALADPRAALDLLERERGRLAGAPARRERLTAARQERSHFEGVLATLIKELERIPPEQRIPPEEAQAAAERAEGALRDAEEWQAQCEREVQRMERDLESAESLRTDLAGVEVRSERLKKLVTLLGKTGLQAALVGEALETVTSHANAFLQRLTGGSLRLELERGDGDALDLKAIDATCMREARSVQVLSGSQKFRCAVAVASGIGQYAGAGGMRSIVIDEGFGSLDQEGQHLIIEELKTLAEHMDRVIVVSHLDAFTNRAHFPDQLRIVPEGEGSRIERVH